MQKTKSKLISATAIIKEAKTLGVNRFMKKYWEDNALSVLDIDNILNYKEGFVSINFEVKGKKTVNLTWFDGKFDSSVVY